MTTNFRPLPSFCKWSSAKTSAEDKSFVEVSVGQMSEPKRRWENVNGVVTDNVGSRDDVLIRLDGGLIRPRLFAADELRTREKMSAGNVTKYQNGTGLVADKTKAGLGLFQTVLLSLSVVSSIVLLLSLVYYVLRKRALNEARHHLVPLYHFDPGEYEDWEEELLQDSKDTLRNGPKFYTSMSSSV